MLIEREQYYLDTLKPFCDNGGYNVSPTAGSTLGTKWTEERRIRTMKTRKEIGQGKWNKGKTAWNKGVPCKESTKKLISERNGAKERVGKLHPKAKPTMFTAPDGEKILFESINSECKIRELHVSAMCEVARGVRKQYKGWTR